MSDFLIIFFIGGTIVMNENEKQKEEITQPNDLLKALYSSPQFMKIVIIGIVVVVFLISIFTSKKSETRYSITSVLKDVNVISELSTLLVSYNSIYIAEEPKKKATDETKYKYYTAYDGLVTFGLDLKKVGKPTINDDEKKITINMPEIKLIDTVVDHNSLETIYVNKKYDIEGSLIDRRKECDEDLRNKANSEPNIYRIAKENAEDTIRSLLTPIVNKQYNNYEIVFIWR